MTEKTTLLAYLVPKLTSGVEDAATEALAFILNGSAACRGALNRLMRDGGFDLEPIERVETQVIAEDGSRPDLIGADQTGSKRLIVEAKFWAALGERQASVYFGQLDKDKGSPGVLLFIAPESRRETLWKEIERQMNEAGKELERGETIEDVRRTGIVGSKNGLMLVSWDLLLRRMVAAVPDDPLTAANVQQLRDLARQQDEEAFQPIHTEELAPSLARRIRSMNQLIDDAINSRHEELGITTKDRQATPQREGYGRYFRFIDVEREFFEGEFFLGVNFRLWATTGIGTPLWLSTGKTARVDVGKLRSEFPSTQENRGGTYEVPIRLKTGEEYHVVLDDVVSQIRKIKDAVSGSGRSVHPSTRPE